MQPIPVEYEMFCIDRLKALGMLRKIEPDELKVGKEGVVISLCSDGHRFKDCYTHIAELCQQIVDIKCVHPVSLNGGAMLMGMGNKLSKEKQLDGDSIFRNILEACASEMKNTNNVLLYSHFPCGIAKKNGLCVLDQGQGLIMAKNRLQAANPDLQIKCFFHVDFTVTNPSRQKKTYFMPKDRWTEEALQPILHECRDMCRAHQERV